MDMGKFLKSLRVDRGLTQRELANRLDVDATYLCHLERGSKKFLGRKMLEKLDRELVLTKPERQQLEELREIASGKMAIPEQITTEAAAMMRALAEASFQMTAREMVLTRMIVEVLSNTDNIKEFRELKPCNQKKGPTRRLTRLSRDRRSTDLVAQPVSPPPAQTVNPSKKQLSVIGAFGLTF